MSLSVAIYLDLEQPPKADLNETRPEQPFTTIELGGYPARVYIAVRSHAEADALIKAALAARDLLAGPEPEPCGDIAEHTKRSCELAPGHEGWHRSGAITWPWAADSALPPATHCPICGGKLDGNGAHTTRNGVSIAPEGAQ